MRRNFNRVYTTQRKIGDIFYHLPEIITQFKEKEMGTKKSFDLFTLFALNYRMDFIREAFANEPSNIIDHMEIKFMECYSRHGSYGAMVAFWRSISDNYREVLSDYITKQKN